MPRIVGRQRDQNNVQAQILEEYYKRNLAIPLLDHLITEMEKYFNHENDKIDRKSVV